MTPSLPFRVLFGLILVLVASSTAAATTSATTADSQDTITFLNSKDCGQSTCIQLEVTCKNIPPRTVEIRKTNATGPNQGAIIFTTGGFGNDFYGDNGPQRIETINFSRMQGLDVYELRWANPKGWADGAAGFGYRKALCGYAAVVNWLTENPINSNQPVCTQGNSGGALQIAYGLTYYELEDNIDAAILSGGPPISQLAANCFGRYPHEYPDAEFAPGGGARIRTDFLQGFQNNGNYCEQGIYEPFLEEILERDSIVGLNPLVNRDYQFSSLNLTFINSELDQSAIRGKSYYDQITSQKNWIVLEGDIHTIDSTPIGAEKVRQAIKHTCLP